MAPGKDFIRDVADLWPATGDPETFGILMGGVRIGTLIIEGDDDWVHLRGIRFEEAFRGRGHGSDVMGRLCEMADRHGCEISLDAYHPEGLDGDGPLPRFYRRFGFGSVEMSDEDSGMATMVRDATPPDRSPSP